ncbi:MAG: hypothetical protein IJ055_09290 [Oscillospiraceae bacterium]|nr:hypothetical protein [Oscillospiraceae bacterium]
MQFSGLCAIIAAEQKLHRHLTRAGLSITYQLADADLNGDGVVTVPDPALLKQRLTASQERKERSCPISH